MSELRSRFLGERGWHPLAEGCPPAWASEWGEDRFGVFVGVVVGKVEHRMRWIRPGTFWMDSMEGRLGRIEDEGPKTKVTVSRGYWVAETPVTQALWQEVMGRNPSQFRGAERPVEHVSWEDCRQFCSRLNTRIPGLGVRLPGEAEWEYACRAGTQTATYAGDLDGEDEANVLDEIAWYRANSGAETHEVGKKQPNSWGLYDMLGNVREWCMRSQQGGVGPPDMVEDRFSRGGSWSDRARSINAGASHINPAYGRSADLGLRLFGYQEELADSCTFQLSDEAIRASPILGSPRNPPQILLLLDLSLDHPIPEDEVLALLPPSNHRQVLRVSKFGAQATTRGQQWNRWRAWTLAVDRMLAEAQANTAPGLAPHYYVAGRASLPLFAYVGLRRGRLGELTVLNQRGADWDIIPTTPRSGPGGQPVFDDPRVLPGTSPDGLVGVFVSTGYPAPEAAIASYFERHNEKLAATVVLETPPERRWIDAEAASDAARQVQSLMLELRRCAPNARGAVLFLAGPASLAVMAGRYLNPHMYRPIWIPAFDANDYREAVRWPHGAAHGDIVRILMLTASPADLSPIQVAKEEKEVKQHILAGRARGARVELNVVRGAMLDDILSAINEFRPHILHIAAHGSQDGELWLLDDRGDRVLMPLAGFLAAIQAAANDLTLILLNACYSAAAGELLRRHVDCAIGVRTAVADESALVFIAAFYAALGHGLPVSVAHEQGLAQLKLKCLPNSGDIELLVRPGCDAGDWIPLPGAARASS